MNHDILPIEWSAEMRMNEALRLANRERWARKSGHKRDRQKAQGHILTVALASARS